MKALPVYDNRYIKTKIKTYGDTNFRGLNMQGDGVEWESFTIISIDSIHVYENKCNLEVYLDNCAYKIVGKQIIDYLHDHRFDSDENQFFI